VRHHGALALPDELALVPVGRRRGEAEENSHKSAISLTARLECQHLVATASARMHVSSSPYHDSP
jgi:hypothetical protein